MTSLVVCRSDFVGMAKLPAHGSVNKCNDSAECADHARPLQALTTTLVGSGHARPDFFTDPHACGSALRFRAATVRSCEKFGEPLPHRRGSEARRNDINSLQSRECERAVAQAISSRLLTIVAPKE